MKTLNQIIKLITEKGFQIKLITGYRDSINGYGWHVVYLIEIIKCIEYCSKCRIKYSVNYNDDTYPFHHQHSHNQEYKTIFCKEFIDIDKLINELNNFYENNLT